MLDMILSSFILPMFSLTEDAEDGGEGRLLEVGRFFSLAMYETTCVCSLDVRRVNED